MTRIVTMRVKVAELKSRLSHYLREVGESGQDIEICVRETPVAYLVARRKEAALDPAEQAEAARLREALAAAGLALDSAPVITGPLPPVRPILVAKGSSQTTTVSRIRREREW